MTAIGSLVGSLQFRGIGTKGAIYPAWFTQGRGRSGVYVIRCAHTHAILYVGESHTGRLYKTASRHFAAWNDRTGHRGSRHHWHVVFDRRDVEVALLFRKRACHAITVQNTLIRELKPLHNNSVMGLTADEVRAIRASEAPIKELAERFGKSEPMIRHIRIRRYHRHT